MACLRCFGNVSFPQPPDTIKQRRQNGTAHEPSCFLYFKKTDLAIHSLAHKVDTLILNHQTLNRSRLTDLKYSFVSLSTQNT